MTVAHRSFIPIPIAILVSLLLSLSPAYGQLRVEIRDQGALLRILGRDSSDQLGLGLHLVYRGAMPDQPTDLLIGSPQAYNEKRDKRMGRVDILEVATLPSVGLIDLKETSYVPRLTIFGISESSRFGQQIVSGDFDGDQIKDLAIGAPGTKVNDNSNTGMVFIFLGGKPLKNSSNYLWSFQGTITVDNAQVMITGEEKDAQTGFQLAVGNFDADLYDDLTIGAPGAGQGGSARRGRVYVIQGRPDWTDFDSISLGTARLTPPTQNLTRIRTYVGARKDDRLGESLAAGNFDGLGGSELVIGADHQDRVVTSATGTATFLDVGYVHLFEGSSVFSSTPEFNLLLQKASFTIRGKSEFDLFGDGLFFTDWDSDGKKDLWIGAPYAEPTPPGNETDDWGIAGLFPGTTFNQLLSPHPSGEVAFPTGFSNTVIGPVDNNNNETLFASDMCIGDVISSMPGNEMIFTASLFDSTRTGSMAGMVSVIDYSRVSQSSFLNPFSLVTQQENIRIEGAGGSYRFGYRAESADLNPSLDGDELIVSSPRANANNRDGGIVYIFNPNSMAFPRGILATPTYIPTYTVSPTFTFTPTFSETPTVTPTTTITHTVSHTVIPTNSYTHTLSPSSTMTPTSIATPTETMKETQTPKPTETHPPTPTFENTQTMTPVPSETSTSQPSPSATPTTTESLNPTVTATNTDLPTLTMSPTEIPPTVTGSPTPTETPTTELFTHTPTKTSTSIPSHTMTSPPTATFTPTLTITPTNSATWSPSPTQTIPTPTASPIGFKLVGPGQVYETIQAAINDATNGDVIRVLPGVYKENLEINGKDIILAANSLFEKGTAKGLIPDVTIDGRKTGPVFTFKGTESAACRIQGFVITNGFSTQGGGILGAKTKASILGNAIVGNNAVQAGGGIYYCNGMIAGNIIKNNTAEIGGGLESCSGSILGNTITLNVTTGVSLGGGGIANSESTSVIACNVITQNISQNDGGGLYGCGGDIHNNIIAYNQAEEGGGMYGCYGLFLNNVLWENVASIKGGGSHSFGSQAGNRFENNIVWGNSAPNSPQLIHQPSFATNTPNYCCIQNWSGGGTGNLTDHPMLLDPPSGSFHLSGNSPCVDKGNPSLIMEDQCLPPGLGESTNDIGAYGGPHNCLWSELEALLEFPKDDYNKDMQINYLDLLSLSQIWMDPNKQGGSGGANSLIELIQTLQK